MLGFVFNSVNVLFGCLEPFDFGCAIMFVFFLTLAYLESLYSADDDFVERLGLADFTDDFAHLGVERWLVFVKERFTQCFDGKPLTCFVFRYVVVDGVDDWRVAFGFNSFHLVVPPQPTSNANDDGNHKGDESKFKVGGEQSVDNADDGDELNQSKEVHLFHPLIVAIRFPVGGFVCFMDLIALVVLLAPIRFDHARRHFFALKVHGDFDTELSCFVDFVIFVVGHGNHRWHFLVNLDVLFDGCFDIVKDFLVEVGHLTFPFQFGVAVSLVRNTFVSTSL